MSTRIMNSSTNACIIPLLIGCSDNQLITVRLNNARQTCWRNTSLRRTCKSCDLHFGNDGDISVISISFLIHAENRPTKCSKIAWMTRNCWVLIIINTTSSFKKSRLKKNKKSQNLEFSTVSCSFQSNLSLNSSSLF